MNLEKFKKIVVEIVKEANNLKDKHTEEKNAPVNYACIFSQETRFLAF